MISVTARSSLGNFTEFRNEHGEFREWLHVFTFERPLYYYQFAVPWLWKLSTVTMQDATCMALLGALDNYPGQWCIYAEFLRSYVNDGLDPIGIVIPALNPTMAHAMLSLIRDLSDYRLICKEVDK